MVNEFGRMIAQFFAALALLGGILALVGFFAFTDTVLQEIAVAALAGALFMLAAVLMLGVLATYADDILSALKRTSPR